MMTQMWLNNRSGKRSALAGEEIIVDNFAGGGGAMGRCVDVAINHNPYAVELHSLNHPNTRHLCEDVFAVDPVEACGGRPVGLAWFSPDCTHFSVARGGKPKSKRVRGLAWVAVKWARAVRPRVIILENVREYLTWGPLDSNGQPKPDKKGLTFRRWLGYLRALGYVVEWRILNAADYGAPTHRKRLFLVARCDGRPIVWPDPTHGPGRAQPWRSASECIDWTNLGTSIFERSKPLADATCKRIAKGIVKYVLQAERPFIIGIDHQSSGDRPVWSVDEPLTTITAENRHGLVVSILSAYRGSKSGESRCNSPSEPLRTQDTSNRYGLVSALIAKHYGGVIGHGVDRPLGTVTGRDHHSLVACHLTKFYGTNVGSDLLNSLPTITGQGQHFGLVAAFMLKYYTNGGQWSNPADPIHTIVSKARMGLVTMPINGEEWAIRDVLFRMMFPRELAKAQGFPSDYILIGTQEQQVDAIGNSVSPYPAAAVVSANFGTNAKRGVA